MGTVKSETVRAEYSSGTGWEAGNLAPATKWLNEAGEVVDSEPTGIGRVLIAQGDVVRPYMVDVLGGSTKVSLDPRHDNENSMGDSSHGREPLDDDESGEPGFGKMGKADLEAEVDARNAARPDESKIDRKGTKAELVERLQADDSARVTS